MYTRVSANLHGSGILDLLTKRDKKINNCGLGASQHQHQSAVVSRLPRGCRAWRGCISSSKGSPPSPSWRFSKTKLLTCSPITGHWDVTHRIQTRPSKQGLL
ncbi:hypothetical protein CEXT_631341 [Caerostris extrusa]|uniref:Uncharacterized protein n=1 Tax=Caerostris extrusa TaxID=172846 RepID=A0AAV4Y9Z7_CAEEX|nr:hypothetical protein CEXT_631341 [Caerostris extrusa]